MQDEYVSRERVLQAIHSHRLTMDGRAASHMLDDIFATVLELPSTNAQAVAWQPMDSAPKEGGYLLLLLPEFEGWASTWWPGRWSFADNQWIVRTPYFSGGKQVVCSDLPEPLGWMSLPSGDAKEA